VVKTNSDRTAARMPHMDLSLVPETACLADARREIRDFLAHHCTDKKAVSDMVLAVEEACSNAICHSGSSEHIHVRLSAENDQLEAMVKDKGRGFEIDDFDPLCLPDALSNHGRGLFLMARLCDELRLHLDGGLEVLLRKRTPLAASAEAWLP